MSTLTPRLSAVEINSAAAAGVRCAESTRFSWGTPNWVRMSQQCFMTSQSDLLPMMTATILLSLGQGESGLAVVVAQTVGHSDRQAEADDATEKRNDPVS